MVGAEHVLQIFCFFYHTFGIYIAWKELQRENYAKELVHLDENVKSLIETACRKSTKKDNAYIAEHKQ